MLLQPSPIRPSPSPSLLPFSRSPSPLPTSFLPLRLRLSFIPSALSRRTRSSPLNKRRQSDVDDDNDDAAWDLDDDEDIDDFDEAFEERKPRGFVADGMRYDTSLEERLLKEIQGNRKDQTESLSKDKVKVKREPSQTTKKKGVNVKSLQNKNAINVPSKIASTSMTSGIRVRLWNLPKKRNIQRDLQNAFKGFRGILHIDPANSGNKKTRDPVCKGFAFVQLATDEVATRFVETYSSRSISFGRVEKQISCCIINPNANSINPNVNPTTKKLSNFHKSQMLEPQLHDGFMGISENINQSDESPIIFVEEDDDDDDDDDEEEEEEEEEEESLSSFEMMDFDDEEADEEESDSEIVQLPSEKKKALRRRRVRPRRANSSKLSLPLRLKGRERDVLSGVFSKYSTNSGAAPTRK